MASFIEVAAVSDFALISANAASTFTLHIFHGSRSGPPTETWPSTSTTDLSILGGIAGVGDVNGDGLGDYVLIGDQLRLVLGSPSAVSIIAATSAPLLPGPVLDGVVVRTANDLNGDGFDDVVVSNGIHATVFPGARHPDWSSGGVPLQVQ